MSLGIAFKGPEGIVLAADSRVTLFVQQLDVSGQVGQVIPATFDNATKLLKVRDQQHVGAVTYGLGAIGNASQVRTAHSFLPEFESELHKVSKGKPLTVENFAKQLSKFFMGEWERQGMPPSAEHVGDNMIFLIGGYDDRYAVYGKVFDFYIPSRPEPVEQQKDTFGLVFGGQQEVTARLLNGFDHTLVPALQQRFQIKDEEVPGLEEFLRNHLSLKIPYTFLPLQDCVDLSVLLVQTTIELQTFQVGVRGVGGEIDVATITRVDGFQPVREKKIVGRVNRGSSVKGD